MPSTNGSPDALPCGFPVAPFRSGEMIPVKWQVTTAMEINGMDSVQNQESVESASPITSRDGDEQTENIILVESNNLHQLHGDTDDGQESGQ